jgi:hypothetical protein
MLFAMEVAFLETDAAFYTRQSVASDPGTHAALFAELPSDIAGIAQVTQGLIYHYMAGPRIFGYCPPPERMHEIDTRMLERMLGRIIALDDRPLTEPRSFENRLVGCCRDASLLACAILRHQGQAARLRYGFADYFERGFWIDHVIVELWDGTAWQRFDPEMHGVPWYDEADIANHLDTHFLTGGAAWQKGRAGQSDVARFGLGSAMPQLSGWPFMRSRLLLDAAALNKQELLCWDQWGIGSAEADVLDAADETLLDQVAALSLVPASTALRTLMQQDERIRVPAQVISFSPASGPQPLTVSIG